MCVVSAMHDSIPTVYVAISQEPFPTGGREGEWSQTGSCPPVCIHCKSRTMRHDGILGRQYWQACYTVYPSSQKTIGSNGL